MSARITAWLAPAPLLAASILAGIAGQVFLAGLAIFGASTGWDMHGMFGGLLSLPIIGLAALGLRAEGGAAYRRPALLLVLLYGLQVMLVIAGQAFAFSWLAALHPVNAFVMLLAAVEAGRRTMR